ncbi:MAG: hypothetical protein JM57_03095 [Comamonadaceae bacterium BICA1-1]|nr:MAG: hypothetical protein JM57_03095 [Comamonadaceae bacterium BICA1-1]
MAQGQRHVFDALALEGRKQQRRAARAVQACNRQRLAGLLAVELVGLGQQQQKVQPLLHPGPDQLQQRVIEFSQP